MGMMQNVLSGRRSFIGILSRAGAMLGAAMAMSACATLSDIDPFDGGDANYLVGGPESANLTRRGHDALRYSFVQAMESGKPQGWSGPRARGLVEPLSYAVGNLKTDPSQMIDASRGDFDLAQMVETELGLHVLTRNSNIRTGPGTNARASEVLPSGTGVEVVGRVTNKNWMLVAVNGVVRGYVFGDLLIKAPGSELELAGGPVRRPMKCRNFRQRMTMAGEQVEWQGAACNDGTGWRIAPPPKPDEYAPESLMEF